MMRTIFGYIATSNIPLCIRVFFSINRYPNRAVKFYVREITNFFFIFWLIMIYAIYYTFVCINYICHCTINIFYFQSRIQNAGYLKPFEIKHLFLNTTNRLGNQHGWDKFLPKNHFLLIRPFQKLCLKVALVFLASQRSNSKNCTPKMTCCS